MGSPKIVTIFVFDPITGNPVTGQAGAMSFTTYKDETGTNLSAPAITEIGGGAYKFTPIFISPVHGIVYVLNTGTGVSPTGYNGFLRPEDFNLDNLDVATSVLQTAIGTLQADTTRIKKLTVGKWEIFTGGPDANRMVFYDTDNTTVLLKVDLLDANGVPTTVNPYTRIPV